MRISGCSAIVSGGASGLGSATAAILAERGAAVFGLDLPHAVRLAEPTDGVTLLEADVTDEDQVRAAVERAGLDLPLRIAVNCAGVGPAARVLSKSGPHDLATFRRVIEINLVGTFNVLRLAADAMSRTVADEGGQRGVIVNTASIAAYD